MADQESNSKTAAPSSPKSKPVSPTKIESKPASPKKEDPPKSPAKSPAKAESPKSPKKEEKDLKTPSPPKAEGEKRKLEGSDQQTPIKKFIVEETPLKLEKPAFSSSFAKFSSMSDSGFAALSAKKTDFSKLLGQQSVPPTPSKDLGKKVENLNFEQKETITGEEGDLLVDSFRCKLYIYSKLDDQWKERGVGLLKISLIDEKNYRLVMRNDGVFKVILNVRIQENMPIKLRNDVFVEFIAVEEGELRKFLFKFKNNQVAKKAYDGLVEVIPTALEK